MLFSGYYWANIGNFLSRTCVDGNLFDVVDLADDFPIITILNQGEHIGKVSFTELRFNPHDCCVISYIANISRLGLTLVPIIDAMLKWGEEHYDLFEKK